MKVFVKTLIICLVICVGCYIYTLLKNAGYSPQMTPNETVVSGSKNTGSKPPEKTPEKEEYTVKVCFLTNENTTKLVERKINNKNLNETIAMLLKGPTDTEKQQGLYSEIPADTRLLWVREENGSLIINLSENFAQGGGATSVMNRVRQLIKTVNLQKSKIPVYLYLNGKKVEYIGGEGVYLQQPLNEDILKK